MKFTRRQTLSMAAGAAVAATLPTTRAEAKIVSTEEAMKELVIGDPNAPVEVIEYASLACPACKHFHERIYPTIKKDYIDTGKVRFVYRDFPTNRSALAAAMITRCAGPTRREGLIDLFFQMQPQWSRADDPLQAMTMLAQMAGIGPNGVTECLQNGELLQSMNKEIEYASREKGVRATPTIYVGGERFDDGMNLESLRAEIDSQLAKAN